MCNIEDDSELMDALQRLKVQTGSLACLGCSYEDQCSLHGCRIIREAVGRLKEQKKKGKQEKWFTFRDRDFFEVHINTDYIGAYKWINGTLLISIHGDSRIREVPDPHRFIYDDLCDATGVEIVKGHPDPKGPRGAPGLCPSCGKPGPIWFPQTDEIFCPNCGWTDRSKKGRGE